MKRIGENIERLQELIHTPLNPPPNWAREWQIEAEHVLHLSHEAKDSGDMKQLTELDAEAARLVRDRESRISSN